jgi:hypothetical protein
VLPETLKVKQEIDNLNKTLYCILCQHRQCSYNVTLRRAHAVIVIMEKQYVVHSASVCVCVCECVSVRERVCV